MTTTLRKRAYRTHPNGKSDNLGLDAGTLAETTDDTATFVITTADRDRDGDIVDPDGIDWGPWVESGAPVLFGHDNNRPPIGTCLDEAGKLAVWREGDRWLAKVRFDLADPFAAHVLRKCRAGILKGASISFIPEAAEPLGDGRGRLYRRLTITELSVVPIPANEHALLQALLDGATEVVRKSLLAACRGPDCPPPLPLEHRHKVEWREMQQFALFTKAATGRELTVDQARKALRRAKGSQADMEPTRGQPGEIDRTEDKEGGRGRAGGGTYTSTDDATRNARPGDTVIARRTIFTRERTPAGNLVPGRVVGNAGDRLTVSENAGDGWLVVRNGAGVQAKVSTSDVRAAKLPAGTLPGGRKLSLQPGKCACKGKCGCKKEANVPERYDEDYDEGGRPGIVMKPSARMLAKLHKHISEIPQWLERSAPELDHPGVGDDLNQIVERHCGPMLKAVEATLRRHHKDLMADYPAMDDLHKAMEADSGTGGGYAVEPGEAGKVDIGEVPDYDDDDEQEKDGGREEIEGRYDLDEDEAGLPDQRTADYRRGRKSHGGGLHPAVLARMEKLLGTARQLGVVKD